MSKGIKDYKINNIINYLRKSRQDVERERKTGEDTLHEQKQLMDRVLSAYGIPYDQEPEIGSGDKISTRPVFQQIIQDLEVGKYDAIAVKEISRMGRGSYTDMGIIYDLIIEKTIYIITPWKIYDPANPSDLRQIRFELFLSREEYESTKERLNGGRYNAQLEGKWVFGPPPFGFDKNPKTQKLIPNEKEAKTIQAIFDYYANGIINEKGERQLVQFRALATFLRRVGIKTARGKVEWSPAYLRRLLANERFIGTLRSNTHKTLPDGKREPRPESEHVVVIGAHPSIIDAETWEKVQHRIENRESPTNTKLDFEPNRLAGLCVCVKCGKKFIRRGTDRTYTKQDGTVSHYENVFLFCGTTACTYVKYSLIEEDILETLKYLKDLDPATLSAQLNRIVINDKPTESKDDIAKRVESRKEEIKRRMRFIQEKHESGVYDDEMFLERKEELDKEFEKVSRIKIEEKVKSEDDSIDTEAVKSKLESVLYAYNDSDNQGNKNKLLHSVFSHIYIEVLEKGNRAAPAIHRIEPYLKSSVLLET